MTPHLFINSITMNRIIMFISLISSHNFGVDVKKKDDLYNKNHTYINILIVKTRGLICKL